MTEGTRENVRVVDRRHFSADGSRRPDVPSDDPVFPSPKATDGGPPAADGRAAVGEPTPAAPPPAPAAEGRESAPEAEGGHAHLFEGLIGFLVENAMVALRSGAGPEVIGQFIDLLEMLQTKTRGNLTAQETRVLSDTLGELKLLFLKARQERGGGGRT